MQGDKGVAKPPNDTTEVAEDQRKDSRHSFVRGGATYRLCHVQPQERRIAPDTCFISTSSLNLSSFTFGSSLVNIFPESTKSSRTFNTSQSLSRTGPSALPFGMKKKSLMYRCRMMWWCCDKLNAPYVLAQTPSSVLAR